MRNSFRKEINNLEIALTGKYPDIFSDPDFKLLQRFQKCQHEEDMADAQIELIGKIEKLNKMEITIRTQGEK